MNMELRESHLDRITDPECAALYDRLCACCEAREGGLTDPDQMLVADIAMAQQIKHQLQADIAVRGVGRERSNGRQKYYEENKSMANLRAYAEQQRKMLAELQLTPASRKADAVPVDDAFANFD